MARSCIVVGSWSLTDYGACTIAYTDNAGAHSVSITAAVYDHDAIIAASGLTTVVSGSLGDTVASLVSDEGGDTITFTFSRVTGLYTIANTTGAVLTIPWTTNAATVRLGKLLGFVADSTGALSYTSTHVPLYCMVPTNGAMARYLGPVEEKGHTSTTRSSAGAPYRLSPAATPWRTSWDFEFETKAHVDRVYRDATSPAHLYTWEDMWSDYRSCAYPLALQTVGADGTIEIFAFDLATPEYDESTHKPARPNDHVRWTVTISALLRQQTADSTLPARAIT